MAIDTDNLDIILRVIGLRSFQAQMAEARASVASVGKASMESDEAAAASSSKAMTRMEMLRKVSLGVGLAIATTAYEGYKLSVRYQQQIEMIHTQAGATQRETNMLYKAVLGMTSSGKFAQGPVEMAQAVYHLESVGIRGKAVLDALKQSADLAAVGNSNLEDTTSAVGAAWRAYRDDGLSFNEIVATLNATVGAGNMRMQDLVGALGTGVLPVFKTAGLTIQDFGGALALLTDEGQHADNAATHLRMAVNLLAAPSKIAKKELAGIGLGALDLADKMKGPKGLIGSLELLRQKLYAKYPGPKLDPNTLHMLAIGDPTAAQHMTHAQSQRMDVLSRAFGGARSGATIMALIDQLDALQTKTDQVKRTQHNFADAVAKTHQTAAFQLKAAWAQVQTELVRFGDTARGPATSGLVTLLHAARAILIVLRAMSPILGKLIVLLGIVAAGWVAYKVALAGAWAIEKVMLAAAWIEWWIALAGEVGVATAAVAAFDAAWALTGIPEIILGVVALIAVIYLLRKPLMEVAIWIKDHWQIVLVLLTGPIGLAIIWIVTHWRGIKHVFSEVADWLGHVFHGPIGGIRTAFTSVGHFIARVFGSIKKSIEGAINDAIRGINFLIRAYNKIPGFFRPTGKIHQIGLLGQTPHAQPAPAGSLGANSFDAMAMIVARGNQRRVHVVGSGGNSPFGSVGPVQVVGGGHGNDRLELHNHITVKLDRKDIYKATTRAKADRAARNGGNYGTP